jgi:acyl carrier protein
MIITCSCVDFTVTDPDEPPVWLLHASFWYIRRATTVGMKEPQPHEVTADDLVRDLLCFIRSTILADNADFSPDTPFDKVGIDSVSLLEILLYLERNFDIYIDDQQLTPENIASVRQLAVTACAAASGS